ncbi:alpha/beta fold hydrolase [Nocardia sp. NBC_01388]|uniref:alpha/beta fold hydrolase n=1 Tax=Nocardia sp. NBC_01388 TaxID=2903596 RepID=UPI003243D63E
MDAADLGPVLDDIALTFTHFNPRTERLPRVTDAQLAALLMPVLTIAGDRDVMIDSTETARRITTFVPNATVEILPGVGHAILGRTDTVLNFLRTPTKP